MVIWTNLIIFSLCHYQHFPKIKSVHYLLSYFANKQTDKKINLDFHYRGNNQHGLCAPCILSLSVTIDSLYKVTEGGQSDVFHRHGDGSFDPACCFTVYHGNHMESLDLVASNAEEARTWVTGLRYLMAGISDEDSLAKRQRTHDQYPLTWARFSVLQQYWNLEKKEKEI